MYYKQLLFTLELLIKSNASQSNILAVLKDLENTINYELRGE